MKRTLGEMDEDADHRPFAVLPSLPPDVSDAYESLKLCILRHKLDGWRELSASDMWSMLDSLRDMVIPEASEPKRKRAKK